VEYAIASILEKRANGGQKVKVNRILVATLNAATVVSAGERKGSDRYAPPKVLCREGRRRPETVGETVSAGVMLLADWAGRQKVLPSSEWPERLHGWLDDWENDFRISDAGDVAAGYQRLIELLADISRAINAWSATSTPPPEIRAVAK
jgi:hypothetical protein